jgi:hypothetical protein
MSTGEEPGALVPRRDGWRGDEHVAKVAAASEVGLRETDAAVDSFAKGFSAGMTLDDPSDGAIVARGRRVLREPELRRALRPALAYLGVRMDNVRLRVHDAAFELRIDSRATSVSKPALGAAKQALHVWVGFGLLGLALLQFFPGYAFLSSLAWGVGLMLGAWQLRRGMVSGRAMLAGQLALALGMLAHADKLVLPPSEAT